VVRGEFRGDPVEHALHHQHRERHRRRYGDTARVRAMFYNPMQLPGMTEMSYCGGYYHHELVRTPGGWRSRHLREENVWFVNSPAGAPKPHM
jgi:hypothetical protein